MDRRRIVTLDSAGTATTLIDLDDQAAYFHTRDSWQLTPGQRRAVLSEDQRRYGGSRTTLETHDNGSVSWSVIVQQATVQQVLAAEETLLSVLEQPRNDLFYEWRAEGATTSVFYEVRGPATYSLDYSQVKLTGAQVITIQFTIPLGPLGRGAPVSQDLTPTTDLPAYLTPAAIPGRAPSLTDIVTRLTGPTTGIAFGLIAWAPRPATPQSGFVAPFGIFEADGPSVTATSFVAGHTSTVSDTSARGGTHLRVDANYGVTLRLQVDAATMTPDPFRDTVDLEVWLRVRLVNAATDPVAASAVLAVQPATSWTTAKAFSAEYGAAGRNLDRPLTTGSGWRLCRMGIVTLPTRTASPNGSSLWYVDVVIYPGQAAGGATTVSPIDVDWLMVCCAQRRACSPTGKADVRQAGKSAGSGYPLFLKVNDTSAYRKTVRANLTGLVASDATPTFAFIDTGLGGSRIELPAGNVDLIVHAQPDAPDDPNGSNSTGATKAVSTLVQVNATPRYWISAA